MILYLTPTSDGMHYVYTQGCDGPSKFFSYQDVHYTVTFATKCGIKLVHGSHFVMIAQKTILCLCNTACAVASKDTIYAKEFSS